jgi:3alpha(or 20beta)-hydroxysteroid dehydrogenase
VGRLDGKVALITGGARGMGESHVRQFVAEGACVVFGDVLDDKGKVVAESLGDSVRYVHHDVTSEDEWAAAVALTVGTFGKLDVLVNNAGVLMFGRIADMPSADFRRVLEVNAVGQWLGMKSVIKPMKEAGGGSIVNISSIEGFAGAAGLSAYSASKFAVRGMTKAAAQELGGYGIRVNSVHPGSILTDMVLEAAKSLGVGKESSGGTGKGGEGDTGGTGGTGKGHRGGADHYKRFMESIPLARIGEAADVTRLVVFLASDESSYSTGSEFVVDGGILSGPGY